MTRAIILSAGQGRRLLPLTEDTPKCLLPVAGRSVLQWQIDALLEHKLDSIHIVTGFHTDQVEEMLNEQYSGVNNLHVVFNPFYSVSDNLASCWMARHVMTDDFLIINGDTVFEPSLLSIVLNSNPVPVTLTIDKKAQYDEDDMKVELSGERVLHVSKTLTENHTHAESIGMLYFRGEGVDLFRERVEAVMRVPAGLSNWFLAVVDEMASAGAVFACQISGKRWSEIDFIADLKEAEKKLAGD